VFQYFLNSIGLAIGLFLTLLISWVIDGFVVRIATSSVIRKKISIGRGMIIALLSIIAFAILFLIFSIFTPIIGFIVGLIGMVYVVKSMVGTGWGNGFLIAIIAWILLVIIYFIISAIFLLPFHITTVSIPGH
jgi:apolipoprotein N-acyltransferase